MLKLNLDERTEKANLKPLNILELSVTLVDAVDQRTEAVKEVKDAYKKQEK